MVFNTVRNNTSINIAIDLHHNASYPLSGHSNTADSIAFNPAKPNQVVTAGCGIKVFTLPGATGYHYVTRYLDGLVQTVREAEEVGKIVKKKINIGI